MNKDLVTVYIPTKSRLDYVKRAVTSVLAQTYKQIEIIVVDDGSPDADFQQLKDFFVNNKAIKIVRNKFKPGACGARNTAIEAAEGFYLTGLDDDDYFLQDRIQVLLDAYKKQNIPVCSNYLEVYEDLNKSRKLCLATGGKYKIGALIKRNLVGNQMFASKDDYIKAGLFDDKQLCWQDYDLWVRMVLSREEVFKIDDFSYCISLGDSRQRISTSPARAAGIVRFIDKYKQLMTDADIFLHMLEFHKRNQSLLNKRVLIGAIKHKCVIKYLKALLKQPVLNSLVQIRNLLHV